MRKMPATNWARINPRLSPSRTAAASKMVRWPTKASTRRLTVLKPLFCLAAVVLPMVTLTTAALADDDKTYPGAMCRVTTPTATVVNLGENAVSINANGAMLNASLNFKQTWICPAVRSHMDTNPEFARITVQENGTDSVACFFEASDPNGQNTVGGGVVPAKGTTVVLTASPLTLAVQYTWGSGDTDVFSSTPKHGYYYFRCDVPPRGETPTGGQGKGLSGVITYKVSEND
jgi:hypothetical protein